jgi:polysaccharide biosynthesis protein PslG
MTLNGDGDKKVWLTEFGADECAERGWVCHQEQAKQLTDLLAGAAATGWSGPAFICSIRDIDSANPGDREDNFGALLTMDW